MYISKPCPRCGAKLTKLLGDVHQQESAKWTGTKWKLYEKDTEASTIMNKSF